MHRATGGETALGCGRSMSERPLMTARRSVGSGDGGFGSATETQILDKIEAYAFRPNFFK